MEPAVREFVAAVLDRSASIGVRGEFTQRYLKDMGFREGRPLRKALRSGRQ